MEEAVTISVVKINALTVPEGMGPELEKRFAARAGLVEGSEGFEGFELLRPTDGTDRYLVYTRWSSEEAFQAWTKSQAFSQGHAKAAADAQQNAGQGAGHGHGHGHGGPAASGAELWGFEVIQKVEPK
ncbi:mycobilin-forming heme oxygenase MhuD [Actinocorallia libanotica]|uniref:Mycobilin-forming heme oxygenase MhuD n=1 Tax=Actinocorallia libanotica TaxID=46162 RepID=A0ABN1RWK4_9ACTN